MCGICGIYRMTPEAPPPQRDVLHDMCRIIRHRGPDAQEVLVAGGMGIGARRLSVIDLETGDQPLTNEDGTVWAALNGEIYNHRQLRRELEKRGHRFSSWTDTEVLVHLYEDLGADLAAACHGMFAFAVYDTRTHTLILGRDRVGQKPLFYARHRGRLFFGSEMKSLFAGGFPRIPRAESIYAYLHFGFTPGPETAFEGVHHVEPSTVLIVQGESIEARRYWRLTRSSDIYDSLDEAKSDYLGLLRQCVEDRLVADVPVGLLLSGGIDSCSIASIVKDSKAQIPTFTVRFNDRAKDEGDVARTMSVEMGSEHHELYLDWEQAASVIPQLIWHYEQPFADSSAIPTYHISRLARSEVTVALTGDGGDECFGGYLRHLFIQRLHGLRWLPTLLPRMGNRLSAFSSRVVGEKKALQWLGRSCEALLRSESDAALFWHKVRGPEARRLWRDRRAQEPTPSLFERDWAATAGSDYLSRVLYAADLRFYLLDDLLVKIDRASMATSLEARSPFLDHRMLEFSTRIPSRWKIKGRETKWFGRQAIQARVPREVFQKRKTGFSVPMRRWMAGPMGKTSWDLVLSDRALDRGLFDPDAMRAWRDRCQGGGVDYAEMLYRLMWLERWHRTFVDDFVVERAVRQPVALSA